MLSTAQQMLQDSRTKIELLRMQIVKVSQARDGERDGSNGELYTWKLYLYSSCDLQWHIVQKRDGKTSCETLD